jgi:hypothetical protein
MDHLVQGLLKIAIEISGTLFGLFLMSQMSRKRRKRDLDTLEDALNKRVKEVLENGRTED